jgi:hypothetical protein
MCAWIRLEAKGAPGFWANKKQAQAYAGSRLRQAFAAANRS